MGFCLPDEIHARLEKERAEMLERVVFPKGKTPQGINKAPWDESGLIEIQLRQTRRHQTALPASLHRRGR